jgi:hypothetical protein
MQRKLETRSHVEDINDMDDANMVSLFIELMLNASRFFCQSTIFAIEYSSAYSANTVVVRTDVLYPHFSITVFNGLCYTGWQRQRCVTMLQLTL